MTISLFVMGLDNMREIKFRGMNFCGKWVYGDLRHDRMCMPDGKLQKYISVCGEPVLPISVGQFTGRCASESAEIFEGDVLEYTVFDYQGQDVQYRGVVEWCGSRFIVSVHAVFACDSWRPRRDYEEEYFDLDWMLDQDDEVKIIGNVHDNPELLGVEA